MFFISTSGVPSVNRIDLLALTLVGPTGTSPVLEPLTFYCLFRRVQGLLDLNKFTQQKDSYIN